MCGRAGHFVINIEYQPSRRVKVRARARHPATFTSWRSARKQVWSLVRGSGASSCTRAIAALRIRAVAGRVRRTASASSPTSPPRRSDHPPGAVMTRSLVSQNLTDIQGLQSVIRTTDSADRPQSVIRGLRPADRTDWEVA